MNRPPNSLERADGSACESCGGDLGYFSHYTAKCGLCSALHDFDGDTDPCLYTYGDDEEASNADDDD